MKTLRVEHYNNPFPGFVQLTLDISYHQMR